MKPVSGGIPANDINRIARSIRFKTGSLWSWFGVIKEGYRLNIRKIGVLKIQ